ncbi:hypothetical protein ABZZ36_22870 [Actinacidiphila glaucinigra]|uniref:hypothetical protein n=1 Tax=Actinacidiphila glaucinigra TaxID=235986 RepID=UPI0033AFF071
MTTTGRRRFRSGTVILGGMGVLAAALAACGSEPDKRCVDPDTYRTLPPEKCDDGSGQGRYYYGGGVSHGRAKGGSFDKSSVKTGGFGGRGSGHGSGGG